MYFSTVIVVFVLHIVYIVLCVMLFGGILTVCRHDCIMNRRLVVLS